MLNIKATIAKTILDSIKTMSADVALSVEEISNWL